MNTREVLVMFLSLGALSSCSFYRSLEIRADPDLDVRALQLGKWEAVPEAVEPVVETDRAVYRIVQARGTVRPEKLELTWPDGCLVLLDYDVGQDCYVTESGQLVEIHVHEGGGLQWADVHYDWIEVTHVHATACNAD